MLKGAKKNNKTILNLNYQILCIENIQINFKIENYFQKP